MFLVVSILILAVTSSVMCYDEKFDVIDVDTVIADDALFTSYLDCFLDKGPCTAQYSTEFKGFVVGEGQMSMQVTGDMCSPPPTNSFDIRISEDSQECCRPWRYYYEPVFNYKQK